jgi:hypothetical protein
MRSCPGILEVMRKLEVEGIMANGRHHVEQSCKGGDLKLLNGWMGLCAWVLIELPVYLLQSKEGAHVKDQVSFGWLWRTTHANGSGNDSNGTRGLRL